MSILSTSLLALPTSPCSLFSSLVRTLPAEGEVLLDGAARVGDAVRRQHDRLGQQLEGDGAHEVLGGVRLQVLLQRRGALGGRGGGGLTALRWLVLPSSPPRPPAPVA
jgi:hypothetical protein